MKNIENALIGTKLNQFQYSVINNRNIKISIKNKGEKKYEIYKKTNSN